MHAITSEKGKGKTKVKPQRVHIFVQERISRIC